MGNKATMRGAEKLVGGRIEVVRPMNAEERRDFDVPPGTCAVVIELDNGFALVPMADAEGNGVGWFEVVSLTPIVADAN